MWRVALAAAPGWLAAKVAPDVDRPLVRALEFGFGVQGSVDLRVKGLVGLRHQRG